MVFTVESVESLRSNRQYGTYIELRLDQKDPNASLLSATSDDKDWVDSAFSAVLDVLARCKNLNGWVRSPAMGFAIQLCGVALGFVLSLWFATLLSPRLTLQNAFLIAFLFALLLFSNTWNFVYFLANRLLVAGFPSIKFLRAGKEKLHWFMQAIVGGLVGAVLLFLLSQAMTFVLEFMATLVNKNA